VAFMAASSLASLFVIRNANSIAEHVVRQSGRMPSTLRGEMSESGRLPELRRDWIHCEALRLER
jgi:hypothetical protein